jgi:hypothetical protein
MSDSFLNDYLRTRARVDQLERIENGGGGSAEAVYITLRRTGTLAITTAGTIITWQDEVRSNGITWSGSEVTIPSDGYYVVNLTWRLDSNTSNRVELLVNGYYVRRLANTNDAVGNRYSGVGMRYFSEGDIIEVSVSVAANRTILVTNFGNSNESPFLEIVKVT